MTGPADSENTTPAPVEELPEQLRELVTAVMQRAATAATPEDIRVLAAEAAQARERKLTLPEIRELGSIALRLSDEVAAKLQHLAGLIEDESAREQP